MNAYDTAPRTRPAGASRPAWLVVTIGLIGLTMLAMGARQFTLHLTAADAGTAAISATAQHSATATPEVDGATDPAEQLPSQADGEAGQRITVGEVVVDEPYVHAPRPDLVVIEAAAPAGARAAELPGTDAGGSMPDDGDGDGGDGGDGGTSKDGLGTASGDIDGSTAAGDVGGTVDLDLALAVGVETTGHFATVAIDVGDALPGLTNLRVDFGDGSALTLDDRQLAGLAASKRMTVVHEYEPTLTPQPQTVIVTATDADGGTHDRRADFFTQAEYLLTYSALEVTALDDCDLVGKGDFTLTWRLDSRPARQSSFQLGKGDTHVERGFRIGVNGVRYDEPLEFFLVRIEENDAGPGRFTPEGFQEFPEGAPVSQLDNHHYEVTLHAEDVENAGPAGSSLHWDCDVDMTFTLYVTMINSPDRR